MVEFLGTETVPARVVASEPAADLAMLQLARVPAGAQVARLGDSDRVRVGQQVLAIGAPYGLSHSFSAGWISAKWLPNTAYRDMPLAEFFQTTATINTGNSGGPMFNMAGEVVGVVSHMISKGGGSEGLGFVVTMKSARYFLMERKWTWVGMEGVVLTGELAEIFNVPAAAAFSSRSSPKESPAWKMGLQGGEPNRGHRRTGHRGPWRHRPGDGGNHHQDGGGPPEDPGEVGRDADRADVQGLGLESGQSDRADGDSAMTSVQPAHSAGRPRRVRPERTLLLGGVQGRLVSAIRLAVPVAILHG